jgi:phosphoglycolate phosphatase-like HAD superfamily hydrolase
MGFFSLKSLPMKHVIFDCDGTLIDTSLSQYNLFPGIKELILELSEDCSLYVWTARGRASTLRILQELGIYSYFAGISTMDDSLPKPHIAGLLDLVGHAAKDSVCVIGDSSNDMLGAKNFGVMAIGALWNSVAQHDFLKDTGADFIVSHPSECSKLIQLNLKGDVHV